MLEERDKEEREEEKRGWALHAGATKFLMRVVDDEMAVLPAWRWLVEMKLGMGNGRTCEELDEAVWVIDSLLRFSVGMAGEMSAIGS